MRARWQPWSHRWWRAGLVSWALLLAGCDRGAPRADARAARGGSIEPLASAAPALSELELRRATFDGLVGEIRASHVFSSVWPEAEWERQLPALQQAFVLARDRAALLHVLRQLSNSLRDGHLSFEPLGMAEPRTARLPFELAIAGSTTQPRFIIAGSDRPREIAPGDVLLSYDGVPAEALLEHFQFELNGATPGVRLDQLRRFLQSRVLTADDDVDEPVVALTLRHGAHVVPAAVSFGVPASPRGRAAIAACPAPPRVYGATYELVEAGAALCLYRAAREPFASYPIVRHFSFRYASEARRSDHARLQAFLAATPHAGILLDLRDNGGGTAADYVLPWYAPRPHRGLNEWVRLNPQLTDRARLRRALRDDIAVDEYLRRSARGERWWVRPFACGSDGCDDPNGPELGRVTSAPVALLLGPGCRSSCDSFAAIWSREGFGPTLGTPPAAMYTSLRYPLAVKLGGESLGDLTIALCGLRWEAAEPWLEGRPLTIDVVVESSWPSPGNDLRLLEGAIASLRRGADAAPGVGAAER